MISAIRKVNPDDINDLKVVIDSSELFPSEMLDGMIQDFFTNPSSEDTWLTTEKDGKPIAIAYCAPEKMTEGTYNLYLIAVHKTYQSQGIGAKIMTYVEDMLRADEQRVLIVETSGLPQFERTRAFYDKLHYVREAEIRDFYQEGESKVIFWKKLKD